MKNKGQLESFFIFIIILFLVFLCITYYFYFKTGAIPVFTPEREIKPSNKSLLPPGTFFPEKKELPFLFKINIAEAEKILKPDRNLDTFIISAPKTILDDNVVKFKFSGINHKKPFEKLYFQTFLYPLDKKWQDTYVGEKTYYLPKLSAVYIFYVRSRNENYYDPTPAAYYFITRISQNYKDVSISPSYDGYSITLTNNSNKDIDITNWYLRTSMVLFKIPKAVKYYHLDKNKNIEEDIVLKPWGSLKIIAVYSTATSAPLSLSYDKIPLSPLGQNFLGNKCFAYLNRQYKNLNYPAYLCDNFSRDEIFNMRLNLKISENCARYLYNLGCLPSFSYILNAPDSRCRALIEDRFNYNSCFERHKDDKDFLGKEWRVYFDTRDKRDIEDRRELRRLHLTRFEQIELYDSYGLIVNRYNIY